MMAFGRSPEAALSQRRAASEKHLLLTRAETMGGAAGASENRLKGGGKQMYNSTWEREVRQCERTSPEDRLILIRFIFRFDADRF